MKKGESLFTRIIIILSVLFAGLSLLYALTNITYGIDDFRTMKIYFIDEPVTVQQLLVNLEKNNLNPNGFYNYGYFYHTVCFCTMKIFEYLGHMRTVRTVAFIFRLISLASMAAASFVLYKTTLQLTKNRPLSVITGLLLMVTIEIYHLAHLVHPDLLQLFLLSLSILFIVINHSFRNTLAAAFIAGIAFGTKYSGIFLLPFLTIPIGFDWFSSKTKGWLKKWILTIFATGGLFVLGWILTNPYVITNFDKFLVLFKYEARHVATGHGRVEAGNPFYWFTILNRQFTIIGLLVLAIGIIRSIVWLAGKFFREGVNAFQDRYFRILFFLLSYLIFGFFYLFFRVSMQRIRYLIHLYPALLILGVTGFYQLFGFIPKQLQRGVLLLMCIAVLWLGMDTLQASSSYSHKYNHLYLKVGSQLECRYPPETKILADDYSYVPEKFKNVRFVWGVDYENIQLFNPDLVIINKGLSGRWSWKKEGMSFTSLQLQKGVYNDADHYFQFHQRFFADPEWQIVIEEDSIVVLEKKNRNQSHPVRSES